MLCNHKSTTISCSCRYDTFNMNIKDRRLDRQHASCALRPSEKGGGGDRGSEVTAAAEDHSLHAILTETKYITRSAQNCTPAACEYNIGIFLSRIRHPGCNNSVLTLSMFSPISSRHFGTVLQCGPVRCILQLLHALIGNFVFILFKKQIVKDQAGS